MNKAMKMTSRKGFTVLEMMVATTLLAMVMACVFPLVNQMMGRIQMARDHHVAASISQARIERARSVAYKDLILFQEKGTLVDDYGNLITDGRFERTTEVVPDSPIEGMTQMTVSTRICICSRWGWLKQMHPIKTGDRICHFTEEHEEMNFLFTEYKK